MKKIMVALLMVALLVGTVSAQDAAKKGKVTFTSEVGADLLYADGYTGDQTSLDKDNPGGYKETGDFFMFRRPVTVDGVVVYKGTDYGKKNDLNVVYDYTGDIFGVSIKFDFAKLLANSFGDESDGGTTGGYDGAGARNSKVSINNVFNNSFITDIKLTAKLNDALSVEASNTDKRGIFGDYRYASFVGDNYTPKFDPFGVTWYNGAAYKDLEVNNLKSNVIGNGGFGLLFNANLGPATVSLSGLLTNQNDLGEGTPGGGNATWTPESKGDFGFRVELPKIANLVNIAAVYKVSFNDKSSTGWAKNSPAVLTAESASAGDPDGNGTANHAFGLYANLSPIEGLGVSVGYSAVIFNAGENYKTKAATITGSVPLFSGIDLRVAYTAIENLSVYFNNNISFSSAKGEGKDNFNAYGFVGSPLADKQSESYFSMHNTLGGAYKLTDKLTAKAQLGNKLQTYTTDNDGNGSTKTTDTFGFYTGVSYAPNANVTLNAGLTLSAASTDVKYTVKSGTAADPTKEGTIKFAIPVGLKVTF
jgi:hypothetical protein